MTGDALIPPSVEEIERLKEEYGDIFQYNTEEDVFIYRKVGRIEHKELEEVCTEVELENEICRRAVLFPSNFSPDHYPAGITTILFESIVMSSGLYPAQIEKSIQQFEEQMEDIDHQITVIIKEVFPEFTLSEIASWEINKALFYLSRAKWVLKNLRGIDIGLYHEQPQQVPSQEEYYQQPHQEEYQPSPEEYHQQHYETPAFEEVEKPNLEPEESSYEEAPVYKEPVQEEVIQEENQEEDSDQGERLIDQLDDDKVIDGVSRREVRERLKKLRLSDQELLSQFGQTAQATGRHMTNFEITQPGDALPEASWFKARSDLTGE